MEATKTVTNATVVDVAVNEPSFKVTDKVNVVTGQPFTLSNVFNLGSTVTVADRPTSANEMLKASKQQTVASSPVEDALKACDELASKNRKYHEDYVIRGTQALYELLSSIYKLAVEIEQSYAKDLIFKKMRKILKDRDIKTQKNTPVMTLVVKYIVGADRKTAANYSRVLQVAMDEGVAVNDLASYISRRGGISRIQDTEVKQHAKKLSTDDSKERLELLREFFTLQGWDTEHVFNYEGNVIIHNHENETKSETSSFCLFVTVFDWRTHTYKIVSANDLGKTMEDSLLRMLIKDAPVNLEVIRKGVTAYKKKLHSEGKLPPVYNELLAQEIANEISDGECADSEITIG